MAPFDAEAYLRLAGERIVLDRRPGDPRPAYARIVAAANALVCVGAIATDTAQRAVDGYALALALREPDFRYQDMMARRRAVVRGGPPGSASPFRVARCGRVIEQQWGLVHLRYIRLAEHATTLYATVHRVPHGQGQSTEPVGGGDDPWIVSGGPLEITVTDDRGTSAMAGFSGVGAGSSWAGQFRASPPLSRWTAWVSVSGERIGLTDEMPDDEVAVETLPGQEDLARRYLWQEIAEVAYLADGLAILDITIEALTVSGALPPSDADGDAARAVLAALRRGAAPDPAADRRWPGPWYSLLTRRGQADGPVGAVVLAAVTPQFDGMTVVVTSLVSERSGFSVDAEVWPSQGQPGDRVGQPSITWWAADDHGHWYLGRLRSWHTGDDGDYGQVEFWPALDTQATVVRLMPSAVTSRAVIPVPLTSMTCG